MPIYEYLCINEQCGRLMEHVCPVAEWRPEMPCPVCGSEMRHQLPLVAVHDDHPRWLNDSVRTQIQGENEPPLETRKDYTQYCNERGIVVTK